MDQSDVRALLTRVLAGRGFRNAPRLQHFLSFVVDEALHGRAAQLKEYVVGTAVFDKAADFDPRIDASVRVSANKVRQRLDEWYASEGRQERIRIDLPRGSYVPTFAVRTPDAAPPGKPIVRTIAVLPFLNLGQADDAALADGLAEEVMHALTRGRVLRVIARTSAFAWRERREDVREIGRTLGADVIVEGSVRRAGSRLRIAAQLVNSADGVTWWSHTWDCDDHDVIALQDAVSLDIVGALRIEITADERMRLSARHTTSADAFHLYLRGRQTVRTAHPEAYPAALAQFEEARLADPRYPLPLVGIGELCVAMALWGMEPPAALMERARRAALDALSLEPDLAEAIALLGTIAARYDFDFKGAEQHFQRALLLNPSSASTATHYALTTLAPLGRLDEALDEAARARAIDPLDPYPTGCYHWFGSLGGDDDEAVRELTRLVELQPHEFPTRFILASILISADRGAAGAELLEQLMRETGRRPVCLGFQTLALARNGERERAVAVKHELGQMALHGYAQPVTMALAHAAVGEMDEAFGQIERAFAERDSPLIHLGVERMFRELWPDPRFERACQRLGVPGRAVSEAP